VQRLAHVCICCVWSSVLVAKRLAQLPRPVMANRSNSSITINVDRRGAADADIQVYLRWCMMQRCKLSPAYYAPCPVLLGVIAALLPLLTYLLPSCCIMLCTGPRAVPA
jgi:hypothetical protein